mgnify:FL=1
MERYDYRESIRHDIREWVSENYSLDALRPQLAYDWEGTLDKLESQMRAQVTGSDCGSYTCNRWQAEEFLCHNLDLLEAECRDCGVVPDLSNPEACDVLIREHEFDFVFASVMDEIKFRGL